MKRLQKKHIDRLERLLRHLRDAEATSLVIYGACIPGSMRAVSIKDAESIEAALLWIAHAKEAA